MLQHAMRGADNDDDNDDDDNDDDNQNDNNCNDNDDNDDDVKPVFSNSDSSNANDSEVLVLQPLHPGTVGRGRSSCVQHRRAKKLCPDTCAAKQSELLQAVQSTSTTTASTTDGVPVARPIAVVMPLGRVREQAALKRRRIAERTAMSALLREMALESMCVCLCVLLCCVCLFYATLN